MNTLDEAVKKVRILREGRASKSIDQIGLARPTFRPNTDLDRLLPFLFSKTCQTGFDERLGAQFINRR